MVVVDGVELGVLVAYGAGVGVAFGVVDSEVVDSVSRSTKSVSCAGNGLAIAPPTPKLVAAIVANANPEPRRRTRDGCTGKDRGKRASRHG